MSLIPNQPQRDAPNSKLGPPDKSAQSESLIPGTELSKKISVEVLRDLFGLKTRFSEEIIQKIKKKENKK